MQQFFKADNKIDFNKELTPDDYYYLQGKSNPYDMINREKVYALVFSEKYSEKIARILFYAKLLYSTFWAIESYLLEDDEHKQAIYKMYTSDFVPFKLSFEIDLKDKAYLQWNFNSLKSASETILGLNATSDRKEVKMCKRCGNPFIAKNIQSDYCSATCRNTMNIYNSRARRKKQ